MSWLSEALKNLEYERRQEAALLNEADRAHQRERLPRAVSTATAADLIDRTTGDMIEAESEFRDRSPSCGTPILFILAVVALIFFAIGAF